MLGKSIQLTYHHHGRPKDIPKGWLAIMVGQGQEQQRITIPLIYLNHPLFVQLLKEAEEEYGFAQKGNIVIPCQVAEFKHVQHLIDGEKRPLHHHHNHNHNHSHHHHHLVGCFRA